MTSGIVYVAIGEKAQAEARESIVSLLECNKRYTTKVKVLKEVSFSCPEVLRTGDQLAHWAKVSVDQWSPFSYTLLLDADTRIKGELALGFKILQAGWELVMVPSEPTREGATLWHLTPNECNATFEELGTWRHIMLNTGVMYFRRSDKVLRLFEIWREEWLRFKDRDQGALLRALRRQPVHLWLLGWAYNSRDGEVVEHLFGRAR